MIIETDRLCLTPLTAKQLRLWVEDIKALEKELGCDYRGQPIEGSILNIVRGQIDKTENDESNYLYHSFWLLIRKSDRIVVGIINFKDIPNEDNEVEIGYGLGKDFEHKGYMSETVKAFCHWAMEQNNISYVLAQTNLDNIQSQNVLKRCGFVLYKQDKTLWWRYG